MKVNLNWTYLVCFIALLTIAFLPVTVVIVNYSQKAKQVMYIPTDSIKVRVYNLYGDGDAGEEMYMYYLTGKFGNSSNLLEEDIIEPLTHIDTLQ